MRNGTNARSLLIAIAWLSLGPSLALGQNAPAAAGSFQALDDKNGFRDAAFGARQLGLIGARIDLKQRITLANFASFPKVHGLEVAGDTCSDSDGGHGFRAASFPGQTSASACGP